jgi:membrane associated rhomboid family serine protease
VIEQTFHLIIETKNNTMKIELNQAPPTHFDFMIFWRSLPFFFKSLVLFSYLFALIGMFTEIMVDWFANYPIRSLQHLQFWRILTAPYVSLGMLHYCIGMINLYYVMPTLEKTYSTAFIAIDFVTQNFLLQMVFTLLVNIVHDFTPAV